jgi:leader peptidase (prepilin peptidase)/N-methyltransferase
VTAGAAVSVELPPWFVLLAASVLYGVVFGRWLARISVRLAFRDPAALPSLARIRVTRLLLAGTIWGSVTVTGVRPAALGVLWVAVAGLVLAAVDLLSHRIPDRVTFPAFGVCAAAFLVDAAVLDSWWALLRAALAAGATFGVATLAAALSPAGLGFGDVKLLGLLGLVLGWAGWGVLLAGVFLGLLTGALVSLVLLATRRAGWRTALPLGPPLLVGAALAMALAAPGTLV